MHQFMRDQIAIAPAVRANEDAVAERESACRRRQESDGVARGAQSLILWTQDSFNPQPTNPVIMFYANCASVFSFLNRQGHALLQNSLFLAFSPLHCQRKQELEF